ncbi:hypothetical protein B0H16DRAFT_1328745, partial [Mycena metata]
PNVVNEYMPALQQFCAVFADLIYAKLSNALRLPPGRGFEDVHRVSTKPGVIHLRKCHPQSLAPQTDRGWLMFLVATQPSLQLLRDTSLGPEEKNDWRWVQPRAGHVVVNLGDDMKALSNGSLHSCLHRVAPGIAMAGGRSFAHLMSTSHATVTIVNSPMVSPARDLHPIVEWIARRFGMFRGDVKKPGQKPGTPGTVVGIGSRPITWDINGILDFSPV